MPNKRSKLFIQSELPRSEWFTSLGKRTSHIGRLTAEQIDSWLQQDR
jgi:hypothetical protein